VFDRENFLDPRPKSFPCPLGLLRSAGFYTIRGRVVDDRVRGMSIAGPWRPGRGDFDSGAAEVVFPW
jgi:hypothetical protein